MTTPLKQTVREHLEQRSLSNEQLYRLAALQRQTTIRSRRKKAVYHLLSALAGACTAFVITLIIINVKTTPLPELIAAEVAENHLNLKPADIHTDNMDDIRRFFTRLDFVPKTSRLLNTDQWLLSGGRYCSIQGKSAAQLRIRQAQSDTIQTVYQSVFDKNTAKGLPLLNNGTPPLEVTVRGLKVRIWVEGDILFAMTDE